MGSNVPAMQFQWRGAAGVMPLVPFSTSQPLSYRKNLDPHKQRQHGRDKHAGGVLMHVMRLHA
jgi:hypothetical protein